MDKFVKLNDSADIEIGRGISIFNHIVSESLSKNLNYTPTSKFSNQRPLPFVLYGTQGEFQLMGGNQRGNQTYHSLGQSNAQGGGGSGLDRGGSSTHPQNLGGFGMPMKQSPQQQMTQQKIPGTNMQQQVLTPQNFSSKPTQAQQQQQQQEFGLRPPHQGTLFPQVTFAHQQQQQQQQLKSTMPLTNNSAPPQANNKKPSPQAINQLVKTSPSKLDNVPPSTPTVKWANKELSLDLFHNLEGANLIRVYTTKNKQVKFAYSKLLDQPKMTALVIYRTWEEFYDSYLAQHPQPSD